MADGKELRLIQGKEYILETALKADYSLVSAYKSDLFGNLIYNKTAQNFNPIMATAGTITIAEVEEIGEVDQLIFKLLVYMLIELGNMYIKENALKKVIQLKMVLIMRTK